MDAFNLNAKDIVGGAYFLTGDDGYLLKTAEDFFRRLLPDGSLSLHIIERLNSIDEVLSCLGIYNFDGSPNVVIVRDTDVNLDERSHKALLSTLERGFAPDILVFSNVGFLSNAEKKHVITVSCAKPDKYRCIEYIEKLFPNGIERNAAYILADYTENNLAKINNESKKLIAYCGDRKISANDVENLVAEDREVQFFSFSNAIVDGNNTLAMKNLEKLRICGVTPAAILASLTNQFQRMLFCSLSPMENKELADLMKIKVAAVKRTRENRKVGTKQLKNMLEMLLDCEYRFKSGEISDVSALNIAIGNLLNKE